RFRVGRDAAGTVVGLAASWPPQDAEPVRERELSVLYVEAAWHGTGLAQDLVASLLGDTPASLWVAEDNPRARRFSEKLGFGADRAVRRAEKAPPLRGCAAAAPMRPRSRGTGRRLPLGDAAAALPHGRGGPRRRAPVES